MSDLPPIEDWTVDALPPPPGRLRGDPELARLRRRLSEQRRTLAELQMLIAWLAGRYPETFPDQLREAIAAIESLDA